jgi:hypothetical protein
MRFFEIGLELYFLFNWIRDPTSLFNNDDAFASFSANDTVRDITVFLHRFYFIFLQCFGSI